MRQEKYKNLEAMLPYSYKKMLLSRIINIKQIS
jgi:hypothetical protein